MASDFRNLRSAAGYISGEPVSLRLRWGLGGIASRLRSRRSLGDPLSSFGQKKVDLRLVQLVFYLGKEDFCFPFAQQLRLKLRRSLENLRDLVRKFPSPHCAGSSAQGAAPAGCSAPSTP